MKIKKATDILKKLITKDKHVNNKEDNKAIEALLQNAVDTENDRKKHLYYVEKDMLFFAFRYALGRMTFSGVTVINNIKNNIDNLSLLDLKFFIKEIKEAQSYGMEMDKREWLSFKGYLEDIVEKRMSQKLN